MSYANIFAVAARTMRITDPPVEVNLPYPLCYNDMNANAFAVGICNADGTPASLCDLSGYSVVGTFVRPDDVDVNADGSIDIRDVTAIQRGVLCRASSKLLCRHRAIYVFFETGTVWQCYAPADDRSRQGDPRPGQHAHLEWIFLPAAFRLHRPDGRQGNRRKQC